MSKRGARRVNPATLNPSDRKALSAARRLSEQFHGTSHVVELSAKERKPLPRFAVVAGDLLDFSYLPPRASRQSKGKPPLHKSGDRGPFASKAKAKPLLLVNPLTKRPVIASGRSPMRLTKDGFVG